MCISPPTPTHAPCDWKDVGTENEWMDVMMETYIFDLKIKTFNLKEFVRLLIRILLFVLSLAEITNIR